MTETVERQRRAPLTDTRQPFDLSDSLKSRVEALNLTSTVEDVKTNGFAYLQDAESPEFTVRLRETLLRMNAQNEGGVLNMLLDKDPIFEAVVLNPKILAIVEILCGKGAMLSQLACSVRPKGSPALGLHADQNWTPAPFPVHNQLVTFCWACDEFTLEGGATKVIPGSQVYRRHPSSDEIAEEKDAIALECPAGAIPFWDGSMWHGNYPRTIEGERVVLHITFSRLALRPVESYDHLGEDWLKDRPHEMRVMLGREDFLNTPHGGFHDIKKLGRTMDWAKT